MLHGVIVFGEKAALQKEGILILIKTANLLPGHLALLCSTKWILIPEVSCYKVCMYDSDFRS